MRWSAQGHEPWLKERAAAPRLDAFTHLLRASVLFEPLLAEPFMKFRDLLPNLGVRKPSHPAR